MFNYQEVLESLKADAKRLENKMNSFSTVAGKNKAQFDALCYEMEAVKIRIGGLINDAYITKSELENKKEEVGKYQQIINNLLIKFRKVGA